MKRALLLAVPLFIVLAALPVIGAVIVTMSSQAAAECSDGSGQAPDIGDETATSVLATTTGSTTTGSTAETAVARSVRAPLAGARTGLSAAKVLPALMGLRFASNYPTLTSEQAANAVVIAQVAHELQVPRRGLEVAIATAIQESKLVDLEGGDRDSGGLFQQRPSTGWGTRAQVTDPRLAALAFFGRASHTSNPGLLDVPGWAQMSLTEAAQTVQRSGFPDAYAQWEAIATDITDLLGGDLPQVPGSSADTGAEGSGGFENASLAACLPTVAGVGSQAPVTLGTLNILGASHTNGDVGRGPYGGWQSRLPGAISAIEGAGVTIAALQEVQP